MIITIDAGGYSPAAIAYLTVTARQDQDPDSRLAALQTLRRTIGAEQMVVLLLDRLELESDPQIMWPCAGWLLDVYGEDAAALRALVWRFEKDPDPQIRAATLQLLSARFGAAELVRRAAARVAANDPNDEVRTAAARARVELDELAFRPPTPAPISHSTRQLATWTTTTRPK